MRYTASFGYEFAIVITIMVAAVAGFYAPEIGAWLMTVTDLG